MGTDRYIWRALLCLVIATMSPTGVAGVGASASLNHSAPFDLKPVIAPFTANDGWLPMVRPAGLSSAASSAAAAAAALSASAVAATAGAQDALDIRQRAIRHPVMGRLQQHLNVAPAPDRLLPPANDAFLGTSNKVEVFAPPPAALLSTFGQAGIRKAVPLMSAQESRFAAFEQSAPSIFFVQPPPAPASPSIFTLPPAQHHGSFPLFPAQQNSFFRNQPQHDFRFIPDQSSFTGLTHSFIPPVDRNKQPSRYLPSVSQSFEIHPGRQPLIRPLVHSQQFTDESTRTSQSPITFPPQRSSPAPFKPFPEQRLPFLQREPQQNTQFQQQAPPQLQQPQQQQAQQQHHHFQQFQIEQPQVQLQQQQIVSLPDQPQPHLEQRPVEKHRITRPYFEEQQRPTVSVSNYGPQTFPTPHGFIDFQPGTSSSFFLPEPIHTEPATTTTTTTTTTTEAPTSSAAPTPHVNDVQPPSEQEPTMPPKRKLPHNRRRKPNRQPLTTTTQAAVEDDLSIATPPPSVLPEAIRNYQIELSPEISTSPPRPVEPTVFESMFQELNPSIESLPFFPRPTDAVQETLETRINAPATQPPTTSEEPPLTARPRRKKPIAIRHRTSEPEPPTTLPVPVKPPQEVVEEASPTPLVAQIEVASSTPTPVPSTAASLSSRLRPRIRYNSTRPSFSLKDYRGRTKVTQPDTTESSSPATVPSPSSIPPRVRYPSRVRVPYRPSTTDEPSSAAPELNRTKTRFTPRFRTSSTTPSPPDTASSPSEAAETKKPTMIRFRPGTGKYVSRFRMTSTTEAAVTERPSRTPPKTTGMYSVRRPAPTEISNSQLQITPDTPSADSEDIGSRQSNQPFSDEFPPETRSSSSSETPLESFDTESSSPASPENSPESPEMLLESPQTLPESPQTLPESPQTLPESPQTLPESPDALPESPEALPESPEPLPESPEALPESPEVSPEGSPESPETSPDSPDAPPESPEELPESPETLPMGDSIQETSSQAAPEDMSPSASSIAHAEIPFEASSEAPTPLSETLSPYNPIPQPQPTGTALEQDNEILPLSSGASEGQSDTLADDMMLSSSSRVADLTSSPNNNYDNPQLRLKAAIPPRISLSTDDPILPIEAFFNSWNKGTKSS